MPTDDDGAELLTGAQIGGLLEAAVQHAGGRLVAWELDHVDAQPHRSTTATYAAKVEWPHGERHELLGVSARAQGPTDADARAEIFADGDREVAVWLYPNDPELPGLTRAAYAESMAAILSDYRVVERRLTAPELTLDMMTYRPRRRAVVRDRVAGGATFYTKVLRESAVGPVARRHRLLQEAGVPAPPVLARTPDHLLVMGALPGAALAQALFQPGRPCTAEQLIGVLDAMPTSVAGLERRPPWTDALEHYSAMIAAALPQASSTLDWIGKEVRAGLSGLPQGTEPTHGDFHEGQVHVAAGKVVGILDIDTIGPGRRADDLACLIAHMSTISGMNASQAAGVHALLRAWVPVFDERVDPIELRLRAAAVIVSLATGPYRVQAPTWVSETLAMIDAAGALVRQVA